MDMNNLIQILQGNKKWKSFGLILVFIVIVGTLLSLLTRITFVRDDIETRPRIAVVGPMQNPEGVALKQGVELFIEHINSQGGVNGRQVELLSVEETPDAAAKIAADKRVISVIGHLDAAALQVAAPVYAKAKLPLVTPLNLSAPLSGVTSLGLDPREEARFVANYARNILQQRVMYVIRESGSEFDSLVEPFLEVYKRFDTPVQKVWTVSNESQLKDILKDIRNIDVGAIYISTHAELAAQIVQGIRSTGNQLEIVGPSQLASAAFTLKLKQLSGKDAVIQTHGIISATPVLFDTANDEAQRFQTRYQQKFTASPDWLATYAYDAAQISVSNNPGIDTVKGINGELSFVGGQSQIPIQMGIYNGNNLISAPVQLLPIAKGASFNYVDALRQGRVLFVNDHFMFKTNVVYVGFEINEVSNVDQQKDTATLDMSIWFRYRGKFEPQDLQILNAVEPVKFDTPVESKESDDVQYRRYRIKQQFQLNFTQDKRAYEHHVVGLTFRHRLLNRNNLMYVVDVLGMPTGNSLLDDLQRRRVLKAGSGWALENAWVSQDVVRERGAGAPQYVGMTGEQPLFSTITMGMLLKPEITTARDVIASEYFIYLAIFGLLGVVAGIILDARKLGRYWEFQSWLLRLIFWPILLLAAGNLVIDMSFTKWVPTTTRSIVIIYESLWWIIGARLIDMAIRRFVWTPLENRANRKVPDVMKLLGSILIFAFAFAGIIAVVLNQTLTSLLATSGVLAMIIGLAIQANIANIFSGIALNIETPFRVGDYIKINNVIGQVKDITWRTVRVESSEGPIVSLANSKVSESFMENYSASPNGVIGETLFYLPPEIDPDQIKEIIQAAIDHAKSIEFKDDPINGPSVRFKGVENINGQWVACFSAGYRVKHMGVKSKAKEELWSYVHQQFIEKDIPLMPANNTEVAILANKQDRRVQSRNEQG
jgi:small-conductance mechanosensitive channel/ABC-type branched-subunit amino acid transport system substrate-binding protein